MSWVRIQESGHLSELPELIHSAQSCISDVKAWMTNSRLQLNNGKTEMILIAPKKFLISDFVPLPISLNGCDIILSNTVRNRRVSLASSFPTQFATLVSLLLHLSLSSSKSPLSVAYASWCFAGSVQ